MAHEEIRKALAEHCTFNGRHVTFDTHEWRQATLPDAIARLLADRDRLAGEEMVLRGQRDMLTEMLRECIGPLEVSAAVIESDDYAEMDRLIDRIKTAVSELDAERKAAIDSSLGSGGERGERE